MNAFSPYVEMPARPQRRKNMTPAEFDAHVLHWLMHNWRKSQISARDLHVNMSAIKTSDQAIAVAERLAAQHFLVPLPSHRRDRRLWAIVRPHKRGVRKVPPR